MKRITFFIVGFLTILLSGCSVGLSKEDIQQYVEKKHDIRVEVPRKPALAAKSSSGSSTVIKEDDPATEFKVFFQSGIGPFFMSISGDNYEEITEFNEMNREYQNSKLYSDLNDMGYQHSKLVDSTFYSQSEDEVEKVATLYLYKDHGFTLKDSDYQLLFEAVPSIQNIKSFLSASDYKLDSIVVNDTEYSKLNNMYEYKNSSAPEYEITVPIRNDFSDVRSELGLKHLIHNDHYYGSLNTDTLVKKHFFKKDYPLFEETLSEIEALGFNRDKDAQDIFLSCENFHQNKEIEKINLFECEDYYLFLSTKIKNNNYKAIMSEEKLEKWWQMLQKVKTANLNINRVQVHLLDSNKYYIDVYFDDIRSIQSKKDMEAVIKEEIGHLIK